MYFSDIPPDIDGYTISIYNKGKRSKDTEVGKWHIFPVECCLFITKLFFKWIYFLQKLFLSGYTFDLSEIFEIFLTVSMMVSLDNMQPGESVDEWHSLIPVNLTFKGDVGSLRVKSRYLHEVIMPLKEYTSLKEVRH